MKYVLKPVGYFLASTALTSMIADTLVPPLQALASPDDPLPDASTETAIANPRNEPAATSATPLAAAPEMVPTQRFSNPQAPDTSAPVQTSSGEQNTGNSPTEQVPGEQVSSEQNREQTPHEIAAEPLQPEQASSQATAIPASELPASSTPPHPPTTPQEATMGTSQEASVIQSSAPHAPILQDPVLPEAAAFPQQNAASQDRGPQVPVVPSQAEAEKEASIPAMQPSNQSPNRDEAIAAAAQRLETHLAAIVEQDRAIKEAQFRQNLMTSALHYAQAGDIDQARQIAHHSALPAEMQTVLIAQIDAIATQQSTQTPSSEEAAEAIATAPELRWDALQQVPANHLQVLNSAPRQICQSKVAPAVAPLHFSIGRQPPSLVRSVIQNHFQSVSDQVSNSATCTTALAGNIGGTRFIRQGGATGMMFPLAVAAPVTSNFGWRVHPITGDRRFHTGTDFGAAMGTPVLAAMTGRVITADYMGGYGLTVVLEHEGTSQRTLYAHLSGIAVQPGTQIEQGMVIGWVGSTGNSTGPHLHFEIRQFTIDGWLAIDPMAPSTVALARRVD